MTLYVDIDDQRDVITTLEICSLCLSKVSQNSSVWKWVIISFHNAIQGAMVCHLSGTANIGALNDNYVKKWVKRQEQIGNQINRGNSTSGDGMPNRFLADAKELFNRLGSESNRKEAACGEIIPISHNQEKSYIWLHKTRNQLTHFSLNELSIELKWLNIVVIDLLEVIEKIAEDSWTFRSFSEREHKRLELTIANLRRQIKEFTTTYISTEVNTNEMDSNS